MSYEENDKFEFRRAKTAIPVDLGEFIALLPRKSLERLLAHNGANDKPEVTPEMAALVEALRMSESRWRDLGEIIREGRPYDNAGFCTATANRCLAALRKAGFE